MCKITEISSGSSLARLSCIYKTKFSLIDENVLFLNLNFYEKQELFCYIIVHLLAALLWGMSLSEGKAVKCINIQFRVQKCMPSFILSKGVQLSGLESFPGWFWPLGLMVDIPGLALLLQMLFTGTPHLTPGNEFSANTLSLGPTKTK